MKTFKDIVAQDIHNVFLNLGEFAEEHKINGKAISVQMDENELLERNKLRVGTHQDGLYKARRLIFVAASDFGPRPSIGSLLDLDGRKYKIVDCMEEAGMFSIELGAVRS